ncbi:hypothetical protein PMAYCL1PPCAC_04401, partial [Pristionchus mayeri]
IPASHSSFLFHSDLEPSRDHMDAVGGHQADEGPVKEEWDDMYGAHEDDSKHQFDDDFTIDPVLCPDESTASD